MEGYLSSRKKKSPQFSLEMLCWCLRAQESQARQAPRDLMPRAQRSVTNWVLAVATLMTQIKAMMTRGLQEPWIKGTDYPGLHLQPPPLALWQNWFAHFWGGSQLEEVSFITHIGEVKMIWAAWLQMQQKAANGRWGSKEKRQGTPWLHFVCTTANFQPCMPPLWKISGKARAYQMAVLMMDTAYVSHLQGRTMQNKPPVFGIKQKDKL